MSKKIKKAVFPVAGLGTRFLPATKAIPKEMLPIIDKPVIQYAVEEAVAAGIEEIIFITASGKTAIEDHFDSTFELFETLRKREKLEALKLVQHIIPKNVRITATRQHEPKGLGHAIWCAKNIVGNEPFAVILPDDLLWPKTHQKDSALKQMMQLFNKTGQNIVLSENVDLEKTSRYGILDLLAEENQATKPLKIKGFVEKPEPAVAPSTFAIVGRYIFQPEIFDLLENQEPDQSGEIQLTDSMDKLAKKGDFAGYIHQGHRFDCGSKVGFQEANLFFALQNSDIAPHLKRYFYQLEQQEAS